MSNLVFKTFPFVESSFLQCLFKQYPDDNAIIELNNLLAGHDIMDIQRQDIDRIEDKYKLSLLNEYGLNLQEFYAVLWNYYIRENDFTLDSMNKMVHLSNLFELSEDITGFLKIRVGEVYYRDSVRSCVSERRLKSEDRLRLEELAVNLQLSNDYTLAILLEEQEIIINSYIGFLAKKGSCSPEEAREMECMLDSFQISAEEKKQSLKKIQSLIVYWETDNLPLKPWNVIDLAIQKSETCYFFESNVKWYETRNSRYGGKDIELIQIGELYITNKRLVFVGSVKTSKLPLSRIIRTSVCKNDVTIHKDKGKDPILRLSKDTEVFRIILKRLMKNEAES